MPIVSGGSGGGGAPTGAASGDLSGTYPGPAVAKVNGIAVTGTPSTGFVPTATSASAATWQAAGWPVRDFIYGYGTPKAESNYDNLSATIDPPPWGARYSDDTNGAWIEWYTALAAGTYAIAMRPYPYSGSGILAFSLNGTAITGAPYNASGATIDTYSVAPGPTVPETVIASNLTIPLSAVYVLRATVTGKNAASTGFATNIVYVSLGRVA